MKTELNKLHAVIQTYLDNVANVVDPKWQNVSIYESYYNDIVYGIENVLIAAKRGAKENFYKNSPLYNNKPKGRFGKKQGVVCDWEKRQSQLKAFGGFLKNVNNIEDDDTKEMDIKKGMGLK